jgi:membrane-bound serine protease (ClpP class)
LVGRRGTVRTPLDPDGIVWVAGEMWTAVTDEGPLAAGEPVEVVAAEGLRLRVRRSPEDDVGT